jgi:hypothetical protein
MYMRRNIYGDDAEGDSGLDDALHDAMRDACGAFPGLACGDGDYLIWEDLWARLRTAFVPRRADDVAFKQLAVHEIAHALASLEDEYVGNPPVRPNGEPVVVYFDPSNRPTNIAAADLANLNRSDFPLWDRFISSTTELPTPPGTHGIGAFLGAAYTEQQLTPPWTCEGCYWFRPKYDCIMRAEASQDWFCVACLEALRFSCMHVLGHEWDSVKTFWSENYRRGWYRF